MMPTFTAILRPPLEAAGRSRRWSAHCLDLDVGVSGESAAAVRMRLACSIATQVATPEQRARRAPVDQALWDVARSAPLVVRQTIETDVGPVEVRYVQPAL
jgi:hypothetical protein